MAEPKNLPTYALPADLGVTLKHLADDQLLRLSRAVIAEQKRRGASEPAIPTADPKVAQAKGQERALPAGKVNAVRAALKAGLTPSRIAKQFGLRLGDIRKVAALKPR